MIAARVCRIAGLAACLVAGPALAQIALYEHDNFGGRVYRSDMAVSNLGSTGFNDKASSAIVRNGRWQLCSDADFRGNCVMLDVGEYQSLGSMGLNDKVSSVREIGRASSGGWGNSGSGNAWGSGAPAAPQATVRLEGKEVGHCRLINVWYGRDLYNGQCGIKQTADGDRVRFSIRMGSGEPYVFVRRGGTWEYVDRSGTNQQARFKDMGHSAVFRWQDFRLELDEDL